MIEHKKKDILLECNLCEKNYRKTDKLYLKTIRKRDYLVCDYHYIQFGGRSNDDRNKSRS